MTGKSHEYDFNSHFSVIALFQNEDILQELINIQWYGLSLKFRKIYFTSLILNRAQIKVKVAGAMELNLKTYGNTVKTAYSILNMLLLKFGK